MPESHTQNVLLQTRSAMEEYASLTWLMDYWLAHSGEMELPGDTAGRDEGVLRMLMDRGIDRPRAVTPQQAASFFPRGAAAVRGILL